MKTLSKRRLESELLEDAEIVPMTPEMEEDLLDWFEERTGWGDRSEFRRRYDERLADDAPRGTWRPRRNG